MQDDEVLPGDAGVPYAESPGHASAQRELDRSPGQEDSHRPVRERSRWSFLTEMVALFAIALTIALLIKTFVVQPFFIPSGSMEDTLLEGDKVLVNKLVYHLRPIQRGDIVVFSGVGSWDAPVPPAPQERGFLVRPYDVTLGALFHSVAGLFGTPAGQTDYIKRVIGVPGDHVACCNAHGQITVNGVPLRERSYLFPGAQPSLYHFDRVVPPGRLWVMGDNRASSADSRLHDCGYPDPRTRCVPYDRDGTIPEDKVIGRAFVIVWPPSRFRVLPIPATFAAPGLVGVGLVGVGLAGGGLAGPGLAAAGLPAAAGGAVPGPVLPLAGGLVAAVPLTVIERRLRLRLLSRLRSARLRSARLSRLRSARLSRLRSARLSWLRSARLRSARCSSGLRA